MEKTTVKKALRSSRMIYGMNANTSSESLEELLTSGISRLQDEKQSDRKSKIE
jgi:hypothetical protein